MWVNPPEGSLNLVVLTARSLVPFHRKWQSGRLGIVGAPWTLRPALTGGLPLNTSVWLTRVSALRGRPLRRTPRSRLIWGHDPTDARARVGADGAHGPRGPPGPAGARPPRAAAQHAAGARGHAARPSRGHARRHGEARQLLGASAHRARRARRAGVHPREHGRGRQRRAGRPGRAAGRARPAGAVRPARRHARPLPAGPRVERPPGGDPGGPLAPAQRAGTCSFSRTGAHWAATGLRKYGGERYLNRLSYW